MAAITLSQITDLLDANLSKFYQDGLESWGEEYSKIFQVLDSTKQSEKASYSSGFPIMPVKNEGVAATYESIIEGPSTTFTHKTHALGYEITEEAIDDNQDTPASFNKLPQALSRSAIEAVETTAGNVFNNAFSTNGPDGVPLCSTAHVNLDGSTQANRPSTDADLSFSSLSAGLTTIDKFVDEQGLKRPTRAKTLLIPPDLWTTAEELLKSEYKPGVANNDVNAIQTKELQYFKNHYLTDTDAWFLLAAKEDTGLLFWWRRRLGALRRGNDFDTTNLKHLATMRFSVGFFHHRGVYGTSGG